MVGIVWRCGVLVVVLLALAVGTGCTVTTTEDDILRQVFDCDNDADCASGWDCRSFAMDPAQTGYCVKPCGADDDCSFGDFCGSEGFCIQPCDVEAPDCRGAGFLCLRKNMMVGETAGYCQPADTCATYMDCGSVFDWCIADSLGGMAPDLSFAEGHNTCVESCVGQQTDCSDGFVCLKKSVKQLTNINADSVPEICVPKCGQDNRCPIGYRCLIDALTEFNPDAPLDDQALKFCVPGLPGVFLPCTGDSQCLSGLCVEDPEWAEIWDEPHRFCVEPCDGQGDCPSARFECLPSEHDGSPGDFCFARELLQPCDTDADCEDPEECMNWANLDFGWACTVPCDTWRDEDCGPGFVCVPTDTGQFGCYVGFPGMPCHSNDQCHQAYGEQTQCMGTTGQTDDDDRICTKHCTHYSQCTFGPLVQNAGAPLCHYGICQPIAFDCDDPTMPYQCNETMVCASVYGVGDVCTIPCDGLRVTNHACPGQFTCAPLPQGIGGDMEFFCYLGYPGLMPCRDDSECLDLHGDGSQRCVSPTGASPSVDGACTMPCRNDLDCQDIFPSGTLEDVVCLPGAPAPGAGVPGYCFMNQSLDVYLEEEPGRQGTFCERGPGICDTDHECVNAAGVWFGNDNQYGKRFCAQTCDSVADCPQTPVAHQCLDDNRWPNGICVPQRGADHARGFWVECYDHRQCADGVCFQPNPLAQEAGHCTRTCSNLADPCYSIPGIDDMSSFCNDQYGVCIPMGVVDFGGS